ncbi:MAG: LacI family DNA-binding transcriptional regulator [Salinibacterium sp.]|nr:LacI family DNA-binding transcriptional regulator [Salinibacterium sp.]
MTVSIRDVADAAGVSVGTVSNVLNKPDSVSTATAQRVRLAIQSLDYVRNDAARQLRAGRSRSIGLLVRDVRNPFFTDVSRGAETVAAAAGLTILLADLDESPAREAAYLELFEEQRVLGVLISPVGDALASLPQLRARGMPVVLVDEMSTEPTLSSVAVDDVAGGYLAVRHLADLGRQRIAFVGGPHTIRQVMDRLTGARRAAAEGSAITLSTIPTEALTVLAGRRAGELIQNMPTASRPDAVFAANDLVAMGILQAFTMLGDVSVPGDIALIGYDDIDFAAAAVVPLSSIRQPSTALGETAMAMLLRQSKAGADHPAENVLFQPQLVVRDSTAGSRAS